MPKGVYLRTKSVWNKGLTKETDKRVKELSEINSISHKGKPSPRKGKKNTDIHNQRMKEVLKEKYEDGTYHVWCEGKKLTPEHIENLRISHKGQIPSAKSGGHNFRRYYHFSPLQGIVCFRSSYEYKYALYLEYINELYMYEAFTFDLGNTTYLLDFYLPRIEKLIDIKGKLEETSKLKIQQFRNEYPWDLDILYRKDLEKLGINMKIIISEISYEEATINENLNKINTEKIIIKGE